jgi:hypothetical protein
MTTRQLFHKLMKERRQHPRGTAEHEYLTRSARKIAWKRAAGHCECGCGRPFDLNHPKGCPRYDHELPDFLGGTNDLENCKVVRLDCHERKTASDDLPKIKKVRREDKRRMGFEKSKATILGSKRSKFKRRIDGTVVRRDQ